MLTTLWQDLRLAIRTLGKSKGFTATAIVTLAVSIGANTAIFSFVDAVLLKPLPYPDADRIVSVLEKPPGFPRNGISTLNFLDWQKQNTVFDFMAAQTGDTMTLSGVSDPVSVPTGRVSAHYFDIYKVQPALGRTFLPDEDQLGKEHVVVLSHALWVTQFGSDASILGRNITLDDEPYTVIGVLPAGSEFDRAFNQIWRPLAFKPSEMTRNFHWMGSAALLKQGVSLKQAQAQMDTIGARIAEQYPDSNKGWGVVVERYDGLIVAPEMRTALYVLMLSTLMVLLIGCANLANLALARTVTREREVAVRAALGASRWRLARQFLTENMVVTLFGGALGVGLGYATMAWLKTLLPPFIFSRETDVRMDASVLAFAVAISVLTGILFGLAPAIQATSPDLASSMKEGGHGSTVGAARRRLRNVLVVAEVALAFAMLVCSGLMIRSFFRLLNVDPGFDSTNVLTMKISVSNQHFPDPDQLNAYVRQIRTAVEAVPGVQETAVTSALPTQGQGYGMPMQIAGRPIVDRAKREGAFFKMVSASYFHALRMRIVKGRALTEQDAKGALPVAVINERMEQRDFPNQDPIGQIVLIQQIIPGNPQLGPEIPWHIVGVVANEKLLGLNDERSAGLYVTNEQSPIYFVNLIVRAALDPRTLQKSVAQAIHGVNRGQALTEIRTLDEIKDQSAVANRLEAMLMSIFGGVALLLTGVGIYGVISYSVEQRTHEIGVRAALGASTGRLLRLVLLNGLALTAIGLAIGLAGALAMSRLLSAILFGIGAHDPATMITVGGVLIVVAVMACLIPARRATKVDPMVALRYE